MSHDDNKGYQAAWHKILRHAQSLYLVLKLKYVPGNLNMKVEVPTIS